MNLNVVASRPFLARLIRVVGVDVVCLVRVLGSSQKRSRRIGKCSGMEVSSGRDRGKEKLKARVG